MVWAFYYRIFNTFLSCIDCKEFYSCPVCRSFEIYLRRFIKFLKTFTQISALTLCMNG